MIGGQGRARGAGTCPMLRVQDNITLRKVHPLFARAIVPNAHNTPETNHGISLISAFARGRAQNCHFRI
jgi:hypothetical protein